MKAMTTSEHMRRAAAIAALATAAALAGCGAETPEPTRSEVPRNVRVLELSQETINEYFEISGPVAPVRGADLSAQESGPVVGLPVAKGQSVAEGAVIVEQERAILKAEKEAAVAALATQDYNVDKVRKLFEAGKVSRIELLTAETAYAQARSAAEVAAERYARAGISAPFDGVVVDRYVELGQLVQPGMPVARVIDPYTLKLEAYLTEQQVRWVGTGDRASVLLGSADEPVPGRVAWVGFEADRRTGKFKVEIEIPNPELTLRSGVIGRARLDKNVVRDVIAVPRDAVLMGGGAPSAYVVEGDRARRREITLGAAQGLMVVVTDGLRMGDRLVVRGQRELRDGSLVSVTETATRADGSLPTDPPTVTQVDVGTRVTTPGTGGQTLGRDAAEERP
jgi:membrane fusion protein (multidrug efflux system)